MKERGRTGAQGRARYDGPAVSPRRGGSSRSGAPGKNRRLTPPPKDKLHPNAARLWVAALALWLAFLSGGAAWWTGTPGMLQQFRLQSLLSSKQSEQAELQSQIEKLRTESLQLERSRLVQQREIRRVLGYAADDEIIFDFSGGEGL